MIFRIACDVQGIGGSLEIKEMIHIYSTWIKIRTCSVKTLVALLMLVLFTQVLGDNQSPRPTRSRRGPVTESQKQHIAEGLASGYGLGTFKPSLEMKENADFLLTPAILVQESLSDGIITTYPTE